MPDSRMILCFFPLFCFLKVEPEPQDQTLKLLLHHFHNAI